MRASIGTNDDSWNQDMTSILIKNEAKVISLYNYYPNKKKLIKKNLFFLDTIDV